MTLRKIIIIALVIIVLLSIATFYFYTTTQKKQQYVFTGGEYSLECESTSEFSFRYADGDTSILQLITPGTTYSLEQVRSDAGSRYENSTGTVVFEEKEAGVTLNINGTLYNECSILQPGEESKRDQFDDQAEWVESTENALANKWQFALRLPSQISAQNPPVGVYSYQYIGSRNASETELTDGFRFSISTQGSTTVEQYTQPIAELIEAGEASILRDVTFNGYSAKRYSITEPGMTPAEHTIFALDEKTVVDVARTHYGNKAKQYAEVSGNVLDTLVFTQQNLGAMATSGIIVIDEPVTEAAVDSPIVVSGQARGYWFFEATAPVTVTNWDGLIIGEGYITADGDWMTEDFVPFTGDIAYTQLVSPYSATGTIIFHRANPSALPENDAAIEVTVQLEDNSI